MAKFEWSIITKSGQTLPLTKDTDLTDVSIVRCNNLCFAVGMPKTGEPKIIANALKSKIVHICNVPIVPHLPSNAELETFRHLGQWKAYDIAMFKSLGLNFYREWFDFFTQEQQDLSVGSVLPIYDIPDGLLNMQPVSMRQHINDMKAQIKKRNGLA